MAVTDSTKKLLAQSLRELMRKRPLNRITVGDICELCGMNRKSFYYHFHDKYELVNWIFTRGVREAERNAPFYSDKLLVLCAYLREEQTFYRAALSQMEQNSLYQCMADMLRPLLAERSGASEADAAAIDICVHACGAAIVNWLRSGCQQPEERFVETVYRAFQLMQQMPYRRTGATL